MANTILRLACFATKDAQWRNVLQHYGAKANDMLAGYGMEVACQSGSPLIADEINYTGDVFYKAGDPGSMRQACHRKMPIGKGIPVIICNLPEGDASNGMTVFPDNDDANSGVKWLPYVLINARQYNPSGSTLLHELIHSTGLSDSDHDRDPASVFHAHGNSASSKTIARKYADRLRTEYYAEAPQPS